MTTQPESDFEKRVRGVVYDVTMREGTPPRAARIAETLGVAQGEVHDALASLAGRHMLVLQPGAREILMAGPFSAVPTPFLVTLGSITAYGNCIWDALGIVATLRADARVDTSCADCGASAEIRVEGDGLIGEGLMHFALPARTWWRDVVFT